MLNTLLSFMNGRNGQRIMRMFTGKRKNNNTTTWTVLTLIGLGTIAGMLTRRNTKIAHNVQDVFQKIQEQTKTQFRPNLNLAKAEIADELAPYANNKTNFNNTSDIMKGNNNNFNPSNNNKL